MEVPVTFVAASANPHRTQELWMELQARLVRVSDELALVERYGVSVFGEKLGVKPTTPCEPTGDREAKKRYAEEAARLGRAAGKRIVVMHRCDNPPCVREDHMMYGTEGDNTRDCVMKNRAGRGHQHGDLDERTRAAKEQLSLLRAIAKDPAALPMPNYFTVIGATPTTPCIYLERTATNCYFELVKIKAFHARIVSGRSLMSIRLCGDGKCCEPSHVAFGTDRERTLHHRALRELSKLGSSRAPN